MSEQITITVSNEIYRQIVKQAEADRRHVSDIVNDVLTDTFSHPKSGVNPSRERMLKEVEAYKNMHASLVEKYFGQYVAIYQGELVDHDADKEALFFRIREKYPHQVVLQRQVLPEPDPVLRFRSHGLAAETRIADQ
jgi:hypothetical protein